MKKIVLLSPFPPAQNPRLVKEYHTLKAQGYEIKVFYAERDKWAVGFNQQLHSDFKLVGGRYGSPYYHFTRAMYKLAKLILPLAFSYHRVSLLLYFRALLNKADLYIGHNLAALPIAVKAAKFHQVKCGFDAEDFHRKEVSDDENGDYYQQAKLLEDIYLPQLNYFTAASPLIAEAYQKIYPNLAPVVVLNVFSKSLIPIKNVATVLNNQALSLFWFSQTIGRNRGLEQLIKAIGSLKNKQISLGLLGMISSADRSYFKELAITCELVPNQLHFLQPVAPEQVFTIAANYDIGLALELNIPYNRNICLTNKIFTYLSSGLAIIASETAAQRLFLSQFPAIGKSFEVGNIDQLAKQINQYSNDAELLATTKIHSKTLAADLLNWEIESKKIIELVGQAIHFSPTT